jgi:hypothetical protein
MYDPDSAPMEILLHVQEFTLHSHEIGITCNGQDIFQGSGFDGRGMLSEDFFYQWTFRAAIHGVNEPHYFELRPCHKSESWYPATITGQRSDGYFEVTVLQPDAYGCPKTVKYPAVCSVDLREAETGTALVVPEGRLTLHVPKQHPGRAMLSLDGESVVHHLGKPSPSCSSLQKQSIDLRVSRDRSTVSADVGRSVLSWYASGEVCAVESDVADLDRLCRSWTVQLGPFAQHTVQVLRNDNAGRAITVMVDGDILLEAEAADIGCSGEEWQCSFQIRGEKCIDFEVFKTDKDAFSLDDTDHVVDWKSYVHRCTVKVSNESDLRQTELYIDGKDFRELPMKSPSYLHEPPLSMSPTAFLESYGITVPHKVDASAPSGMVRAAQKVLARAESSTTTASEFLSWCLQSTVGPWTVQSAAVEQKSNLQKL